MSLKLVSIIYNRNPPFSSELFVFCPLFWKNRPEIRANGKQMVAIVSPPEQGNEQDGGQSDRSSSSSFTVAVRGAERPTRLPEPDPPEAVVERTTRQIGP